MKTTWIPTHEYYKRILATEDATLRQQTYVDLFVQPWKNMLSNFAQGGDPNDPLAGAKAWHWLLPNDLDQMADSLEILEAANAWEVGADALAHGAAQFEEVAEQIGINHVEGWLVLGDPAYSMGRGYTGGVDWTAPRFIAQYYQANDYTLPRLAGATVHELHHLIRLNIFPWNMLQTSVADYIVHEGMAESFAAALFGEDIVGYYVTDISEVELQTARELIGAGLEKTGFNLIRNYIFGDQIMQGELGLPDFGGYAVGYRLVQAYLERTGKSIVEATFVPAQEIVQESGYFG